MVNLDLYRVFYTVAKCGSLTKAAEELYISQPAVSQSIKQLENQLGVSLFNRTHRGMELSAQGGKTIFAKVEKALGLFAEAETLIARINDSAKGVIRIGASETIFRYFLADKIVRFHEEYPSVKIELISAVTPKAIEALKAGECDMAFVNLPIAPEQNLSLHGNCMRLSDVFVVGEKYADLAAKTQPLSVVQSLPLVLLEKNTVARRALDNFMDAMGVNLSSSIEVGSWDLMKRLVAKGMGVGVIPREYAQTLLDEKTLFEVKTDPVLPARSVGLLTSKTEPASFEMRAFVKLFDLDI
ncbi:MAG: LysR family transcriptional regulator [Clostridia bacterium]|nr:LysR family transcriptional regulator [Clostridia bacterium]